VGVNGMTLSVTSEAVRHFESTEHWYNLCTASYLTSITVLFELKVLLSPSPRTMLLPDAHYDDTQPRQMQWSHRCLKVLSNETSGCILKVMNKAMFADLNAVKKDGCSLT
jgi:hypothetical protein